MIGSHTCDSRVRRLLDELGYRYEIDKDGDFKLTVKLADSRSQIGFINSNTENFTGIEIREIYSPAYILDGPPPEKLANFLLRDNGKVKLGSWRISGESQDGRVAMFFAVHLAADVDARTLDSIIRLVCNKADELERELFGTDKY